MQNSLVPETKRKIVVFERLNFLNLTLANVYYRLGFSVMYITIDEKMKRSGYFKRAGRIFFVDEALKEQFNFNTACRAREYALNHVDLVYNNFFAKNKSVKITTALFKSDLIQLVYKKIILEKLFSFYSTQVFLNMLAENKDFTRIYFIPACCAYFMGLAKRSPSLYMLHEKIEMPGYAYVFNICSATFEKIIQVILLVAWPFVLIRNLKKIIFSKTSQKKYDIAIRIYKTGFNFKSECRTIDFLLDGKDITKDNTLFCIETELDRDFREELARRRYNYVDIPDILRELNPHFIGSVYFGLLIPAWLKLCVVSILEPPFIISSYRSMLGLHLRWSAFLDRYSIKNFVVYNDFTFPHIIRNILLSQKGVNTWYYAHSSHAPDLFTSPQVKKEIRYTEFAYLYYNNLVSWGKKISSFYMNHPNHIFNLNHVGCLWSEHTRRIIETNDFPEALNKICAKYKKDGVITKKIIGVFDSSFGRGIASLNFDDMHSFFRGILRLADERKDFIFLVKPKNTLENIQKKAPEFTRYYKEMMSRGEFYLLEDLHSPSAVNGICDLTISACFSSTLNETLGCRKKAIYFDGADRFREYYYDRFPNLVAHGYDELVKLADHWLCDVKDKEFSEYIDRYIKDEIDPYTDGRAISRFRELLMK